jgi:hypothetical protein
VPRTGDENDIVRAWIDHGAFRQDPGIQQAGRFECGLQPRAGVRRNMRREVDELPERRAGKLASHRRIAGVRNRRSTVLARFQPGAFGGELTPLGFEHAPLSCDLRLTRGEALVQGEAHAIERGSHRIRTAQGLFPQRQGFKGFFDVRNAKRARRGCVVSPACKQLLGAHAQLLSRKTSCRGSFVERLRPERSGVMSSVPGVGRGFNRAQSLPHESNLLAPPELGFPALSYQR